MAENIEKTIVVNVNGIDKAVADFEKVEKTTEAIRNRLKELGKSVPEAEIKRLGREFANVDSQIKKVGSSAKGLKGTFRELGKEISSASGTGGAGIAGLFGGLVGGAVGGAVSSVFDKIIEGIGEYVFAASDATKAAQELADANTEAAASFAEEAVTLETNYDILTDTSLAYDDRKDALENLQEAYPEYFGNLDLDKATNEELKVAYDAATNSIDRRIRTQALAALAEQKYTEIVRLQNQQQVLSADATDASTLSWFELFSAIATGSGIVATNTVQMATLGNEVTKTTSEYEKLIAQLKEQELINKDGEKTKAKSTASTKKDTSARDLALEKVKDLDAAIAKLREVSVDGTEAEIEQVTKLVRLYEEEALAKINAAAAVGELSGKTQETLKTEILLNKDLRDSELNRIDSVLQRLEIFGTGGKVLTQEQEDSAKKLLAQLISDSIDAGEKIEESFLKFQAKGFVVFNEQIRKAFGSDASFRKLLAEVFNPAGEIIRKSEQVITANEKEINKLKVQAEAAGTNAVEIQAKVNEAILASEDEVIRRRQEQDKTRVDAIVKSTDLVTQALELAGATSLERIKSNLKDQANQAFDEVFRAEQDFIEKATSEANKLAGFSVIGGSADEGFFVSKEAREKLIPEEIRAFERLANEANERIKLGKKKFQRDIENLDASAADQLIKNAAIAAAAETRQLKATLKTKELAQDSYYDEVLDSANSFAERILESGNELGEKEIAEIRRRKQEQIDLKSEQIELELKIETDRSIQLLNEQAGDYAAQLVLLQEFENKRTEIITKGQAEIKKIDLDFEKILADGLEKDIEITIQTWLQLAQQASQLISNIFDLVLQNQQATIDGLLSNISVVDAAIADSQSKINELESDLEGKRSGRREAILRGIEQEKQREEELVARKIQLQNELAVAERKAANTRKAQAISQALISGAVASVNLWANNTIPYPAALGFNIPMQAFLAGLTATEVALIAGQKFARGGHTGSGTQRDETGHKVAGVVHDNEYVVPKWMVKSPQYRPLIDQLESVRTRGFASGGFTSPDYGALSGAVSGNGDAMMLAAVKSSIDTALALSDRPIIARATEFTNVSNNVARKVRATTIGG